MQVTKLPEYNGWRAMRQRCYSPNFNGYENYGGRGIKVCDRWRSSFLAFYEDIGPKPSPKHTLDRIDNNGDYEPGNVRWATRSYQAHNRRNRKALFGAVWIKDRQKWMARIRKDGKGHFLGYFDSEHEAHEAYLKARPLYFP